MAANARDAHDDGGRLSVRTLNVTANECETYHAKGMAGSGLLLVAK